MATILMRWRIGMQETQASGATGNAHRVESDNSTHSIQSAALHVPPVLVGFDVPTALRRFVVAAGQAEIVAEFD